MSSVAMDIAKMIDMLPENDQLLAHELVKKLVLAWDPDFTKATPEEKAQIEKAEKEEFFNSEEIDWENLDKYN